MNSKSSERIAIYYDGHCPVCSNYTQGLALASLPPQVTLVDLRERPDLVEELHAAGINVHDAFVVEFDDHRYVGPEALHALALLTTPSTLMHQLNHWLFSRAWLARLVYPGMVFARKLLLKLLGRTPLR